MFVTLNVRIYPTLDSPLVHKVHVVVARTNAARKRHFTRLMNQYSRLYPNAQMLEITSEKE